MSDPVWQRLGEALQRRRVEIDPRYRNLALFARETGLNERLLSDIEHARRSGYRSATRRALELAYELDPGHIDRFLAGEVTSLSGPPVAQTADIPDSDPVVEYVRSLPGLPPARRESLEHVARAPGQDVTMRQGVVGWVLTMWQQQDQAQNQAQNRPA